MNAANWHTDKPYMGNVQAENIRERYYNAVWVGKEMAACAFVEGEERARRIVACVNACAGIPTKVLEGRGFASADDETPLYELVEVRR